VKEKGRKRKDKRKVDKSHRGHIKVLALLWLKEKKDILFGQGGRG
jgi:hypothetical protein